MLFVCWPLFAFFFTKLWIVRAPFTCVESNQSVCALDFASRCEQALLAPLGAVFRLDGTRTDMNAIMAREMCEDVSCHLSSGRCARSAVPAYLLLAGKSAREADARKRLATNASELLPTVSFSRLGVISFACCWGLAGAAPAGTEGAHSHESRDHRISRYTVNKRKSVLRYDSTQVIRIFTQLACLRLKVTY